MQFYITLVRIWNDLDIRTEFGISLSDASKSTYVSTHVFISRTLCRPSYSPNQTQCT